MNEVGSIVINTKLATKGFKQGHKEMSKEIDNMTSKFNKETESIKKQELALDKLNTKLKQIVSSEKAPASLTAMERQLKKVNAELKKVEEPLMLKDASLQSSSKTIKTLSLNNSDGRNDSQISLEKDKSSNLKKEIKEIEPEFIRLTEQSIELENKIKAIKMDPSNSIEAQELKNQITLANEKLVDSKKNANTLKNKLADAFKLKLNGFSGTSDTIKKSIDGIGTKVDRFRKKMIALIGTVAIFRLLRIGFTNLSNDFTSLLKSNLQFSSSLNQIKVNLMTAFAPIYEYILPAINNLMNALIRVTSSIATFMAGVFGKTTSQAKSNAKALYDQSKAYQALQSSSESAAGSLASFDTLEVNDTSNNSFGTIDFSNAVTTDEGALSFLDKIKELINSIDFTNINKSLDKFGEALKPFAKNIGDGLKWLFDNVLVPLAKWTIEDILPAFLDVLSGALGVLDKIIEDFKPAFKWLIDNFLLPIAEWTGGVITTVLNGIGDAFKWISENEDAMAILETLITIVGGIAAVIGVLNAAIAIFNIVAGIAAGIFAVITSPITLVIAAIVLLIAAIVLCVRHWDEIGAKVKEIWDAIIGWIKNATDKVIEVLHSFTSFINDKLKDIQDSVNNFGNKVKQFFIDIYNGIINIFKDIGSWFGDIFTKAWNGIKNAFSSVRSFFSGIWDSIVSIFGNIGSSIGDSIGGAFKTAINAVLKTAEGMLNTPINTINSLIGTINKVPGINLGTLSNITLPRLATGTVIPPNKEFAAILGDQKSGTNIEAPLKTIEEALDNVLNRRGNSNGDIVIENLTIVNKMGEDEISKVVVKGVRIAEEKDRKILFVS